MTDNASAFGDNAPVNNNPGLSPAITDTLTQAYHAATERNAEPERAEMPELPADASEAERARFENAKERRLDAELLQAYNRAHEREERAAERNPAMPTPHYPAGMKADARFDATMQRQLDWQEMPIAERRMTAAADQHWEHARRYLIEKGHENPTATDILTFMNTLNNGGDRQQQQVAQPDPAMARELGGLRNTYQQYARSDLEALQRANRDIQAFAEMQAAGQRNPVFGAQLVRQLMGDHVCAQIALQFYGVPSGRVVDLASAPHAERSSAVMVDHFVASKPDMTPAMRAKMGELAQRLDPDTTITWAVLERLYKEARRYGSVQPKHVTQEDTMRNVLRKSGYEAQHARR